MIKKGQRVAIIVLNWNDYEDTAECLKSLERLNYPNFHVYLVDNHSSDHSYEKLREDHRRHKLTYDISFLQTESNLGFAGETIWPLKKLMKQVMTISGS
ncbi:glycosyltransferase [Sporolactobacillus sp. Y61]|uniref:Glycosyltransferase n=1 Tax=Sporolactobacillus sp. Y61 TaxID=3160863 RepID=A0AAU8IJ52_9BACL